MRVLDMRRLARAANMATGTPLPDGTLAVYLKPAAVGGNDANGGTSWADAVATMVYAASLTDSTTRQYILAANPAMAYLDTMSATITKKGSVKIYGGFAGSEQYWEQRDVWNNLYRCKRNGQRAFRMDAGGSAANNIFDGIWVDGGSYSSTGPAFYTGGGSTNLTLRNIKISSVAGTTGSGVIWFNANYSGVFENIVISNCTGKGIQAGADVIKNVLVENMTGDGIHLKGSNAISANNVTVADCGDDGLQIVNTGGVTFRNSIFWGNNGLYDSGQQTPSFTYCDTQGGTESGGGNISSDPLFVGSGDYSLQSGSPCNNTGSNALWSGVFGSPLAPYVTEAQDIDLDGNTRIVNTTIDMGAYERQT